MSSKKYRRTGNISLSVREDMEVKLRKTGNPPEGGNSTL